MKLLENKIALITGASRGIGRSIALTFAEEGATIIFTDLKEDDNSRSLVEEIKAKGLDATFIASDASNYDQTVEVAKQVAEKYGRLDVLVNNAGVTRDNLLLRMSPQDWSMVININLSSCYNFCKAFAQMMMKQRSGSIINTASVVGVNGNAGQCNYSASKAGIIGFSKSLAKEVGSRGIRCNAIAPGLIESAMTQAMPKEAHDKWLSEIPLRRGGTDLDIARTSLFLASDLSEYITGQVICVDGGVSL